MLVSQSQPAKRKRTPEEKRARKERRLAAASSSEQPEDARAAKKAAKRAARKAALLAAEEPPPEHAKKKKKKDKKDPANQNQQRPDAERAARKVTFAVLQEGEPPLRDEAARRAAKKARKAKKKKAKEQARQQVAAAAKSRAQAGEALSSDDDDPQERDDGPIGTDRRTRTRFWKEVALEVNQQLASMRGPRPRDQIREKVYASVLRAQKLNKGGVGKGQVTTFSAEDTATLLEMHARGCTWAQIGEALGRYYRHCMDHYHVVKETAKLGPWSAAEDQQLVRLVEEAMGATRRARERRAADGLADERSDLRYLPNATFAEAGMPWKAIAARTGRNRGACFKRWHFWLSPRARRVMGTGGAGGGAGAGASGAGASGGAGDAAGGGRGSWGHTLEEDVALVRGLYESGAEHESEVSWSNLLPGRQHVRARFQQLARRFGCAGDGPLDLGAATERLLPLLERALEEAERRERETEETVDAFRDECDAAIEAEARAEERREARRVAAKAAQAASSSGGGGAEVNSKNLRGALSAASAPGAEVADDEALLTSSKLVPGQARGKWSEQERDIVHEVLRAKLRREFGLELESEPFKNFLTTAPQQRRQGKAGRPRREGEAGSSASGRELGDEGQFE